MSTLRIVPLDATTPAELVRALAEDGAVLVRDTEPDALERALADAAWFFALPHAGKLAFAIERSTCFRGYSEMHNERDWREQLHLGHERPATTHEGPAQLEGPNLWPASSAWRTRLMDHLRRMEEIGRRVLAATAAALGVPADAFPTQNAYSLLKLICYHARPTAGIRPGVAAHVDFSWLTLTLQDDTGGLEVRSPAGTWREVAPVRGTVLLHVGELLQLATRNALVATPHRVTNRSASKARLSLPVFVNPGLRDVVRRLPLPAHDAPADGEHVHRVLPTGGDAPGELCFGTAEWRRKGQNVWCETCVGGAARPDFATGTAPRDHRAS